MKKFLLILVLSIIGFINFSIGINIVYDGSSYTPNSIILDSDLDSDLINVSDYKCNYSSCRLLIGSRSLGCEIFTDSSGVRKICKSVISAGTYNIKVGNGYKPFLNININFGSNSGGIIKGGTDNLSPAVSSIFSVITELIPYVVYISIGVLLFTFGFVAVKWLVNWFTDKFKGYFK